MHNIQDYLCNNEDLKITKWGNTFQCKKIYYMKAVCFLSCLRNKTRRIIDMFYVPERTTIEIINNHNKVVGWEE